MQRDLQPHQLLWTGGAQIDSGLGALWNRVYAGAAADGAQIQRGSWFARQSRLRYQSKSGS